MLTVWGSLDWSRLDFGVLKWLTIMWNHWIGGIGLRQTGAVN